MKKLLENRTIKRIRVFILSGKRLLMRRQHQEPEFNNEGAEDIVRNETLFSLHQLLSCYDTVIGDENGSIYSIG